ncbi:MAG: HEAT repeat domain-containing protein [Thermoguttaceae bacterium]|jgi:putative heme-binding domain-containing protein|nr:HEAT repeat domain-containing protein [Thermoguttaceae bacterium]
MKRFHFAVHCFLACWVAGWLGAAGFAQGIPEPTDAPKPNPPEVSAKLFRLEPGLVIELVAGDDLLDDPVDMAFDARGRLFVCEIHGYNLEGYYDILELNKTGRLDTKVYRIDAGPEAQRRAAEGQYGTVKLLEDTDGDGRFDKAHVWADRLPPAYGLVPAGDGVIVICPPEILFLADRNGDGTAEVRELLYRTGGGPMWDRPSNPRWNLDNWIYYDGGYRFKPDGSAREPATGKGQFGHTASDWGDRFYIVQVQPIRYVVPLPHHYLARNPYHAAAGGFVSLLPYNDVYPISEAEPWRRKRAEDPAWVRFYGETETSQGYFTSACGNLLYRGADLPETYREGSYFVCENALNFVHRCIVERDGAGYRARRARDDKQEFLASTEIWFRPVNLAQGPDGALYVVDMYREIIEDYSAIPRFLQQQYVESLIAGHDRGRIWRVRAEDGPKWRPFDLTKASADELVELLNHSNAWWRETAQRLLVERADPGAVPALASLVHEGATPQARLHALCTLDGMRALTPSVVKPAMADSHFAVRMHAARLAEPWLDESDALLTALLAMVEDPDAKVRLQVALSLGQSTSPQARDALLGLARRHGVEPWLADAILSSVPEGAGDMLAALLQSPDAVGQAAGFIPALGSVVGARRHQGEMARLLVTVADLEAGSPPALHTAALEGFVAGLGRGKAEPLATPEGREGMQRLLRRATGEMHGLAVQAARLLQLGDSDEMRQAIAEAAKAALDESREVTDRCAAVRLLAAAPFDQLVGIATQLLEPRQALDVQLAAVDALTLTDEPHVAETLLAGWVQYTPRLQAAVLDAVFARENRLPGVLDALENETIRPSALSAAQRHRLAEGRDPAVRQRAEELLKSAGQGEREAVVAQYIAALRGPRDPGRGKTVFDEQCAKCHRLDDRGYEVGPDLGSANQRADETLVADVLDPSREITVGYQQYSVITEDGRVFTGVLAAETATSVTLRKDEGVENTLLRREIDEMEASSISMMPDEMEKLVSPQDVADLIAYLREALGPLPPAVVILFDDEPDFVAALREGEGTVQLETADRYAGAASLRVTPPQRFSASIGGWQYPIARDPGPGQYRYLRFAWKAAGAAGVMIELAGGGHWPPAEQPLRRYYSGGNTTGWAAVEVASEAPEEWTVVTRDLWQDFGEFTLTGIAPTTMGGGALFDRIELLQSVDDSDAASGER